MRLKHYPIDEWPDNLKEFGFFYAEQMDIVINAAKVLEIYNMWPESGSYFDQDVNLVADILRYAQLERYIERTEFSGKDK